MSLPAIYEVKKLQSLDVFPAMNLENKLEVVKSPLKTFIDRNNPQNIVTIWYGLFYCDEYEFYVWMDSKTHKIYQFTIHSSGIIPKVDVYSSANQISEYLGLNQSGNTLYDQYKNPIYSFGDKEIMYAHSSSVQHTSLSLMTNEIQ